MLEEYKRQQEEYKKQSER
jgi:kinesin family member 14